MPRLALPIDSYLPEILRLLGDKKNLVIQASPGSGKTTRVPPAILRAPFRKPGELILVLEPRRLAAKLSARRVAEEIGATVGEQIGYHFRFEKVMGPKTECLFLTEGMLIRKLLDDASLKNVSTVVLDEFHERSIHSDVALAYLRRLQTTTRPDLRLVVMSATLDAERVVRFLGDAPLVSVDTPLFPVTTEYLAHAEVSSAVQEVIKRDLPGDILVFLPGMREILRTSDSLSGKSGIETHILHGELSREEQDRALLPGQKRKAILATNVAETSLTIPGVRVVIDTGLHRQASYSWWSGVPSLHTKPVSKASAIQRQGRAGRTGPGVCFRLYSKADFDGRPAFQPPEVLRADLAQTILELQSLGVDDVTKFPWFEAPSPQALEAAQSLLRRLGANQPAMKKTLVSLPAHPRLGRILVEAQRRGVLKPAALLCAALSEGETLELDATETKDVGRNTAKLADQFTRMLPSAGESREAHALEKAVLTGFPDRIARKRKSLSAKANQCELVFSQGGSSQIEERGVLARSEFFVVLDLQEQKFADQNRSFLKTRSVVPIQSEWLFDLEPSPLNETVSLTWSRDKNRVLAASALKCDALTLAESEISVPDNDDVINLLLKEGLGVHPQADQPAYLDALGRLADRETLQDWIARLEFLAAKAPHLGSPDWETLKKTIREALRGKRSLAEVREIDWVGTLQSAVPATLLGRVDQLVPSHLTLPSGRRARVNYPAGQPPWLESRLQDFFGLKTGPAVINGQIPITLHLLAPNHRAVQVTADLAGFWERQYPTTRKELSRRYPRHAWPENPLVAVPMKSPRLK